MMPLKLDSQVRNAFAALKSLGASDANTPEEVNAHELPGQLSLCALIIFSFLRLKIVPQTLLADFLLFVPLARKYKSAQQPKISYTRCRIQCWCVSLTCLLTFVVLWESRSTTCRT
jgi:hypothetical protein